MANFLKDFKLTQKRFRFDELYRKTTEASGDTRNPDDIRVKSVVPKTMGGGSATGSELSDVDLTQIGQSYYSDSYISRAINKIVGLMFKEGWIFSSRNTEALEYIETRFKLIEESTHIKTNELLRELGLNYVLYGNALLIKTRGDENQGGLDYQGYYTDTPINGLFSANPEFLEITRDDFGTIEGYLVGEGNDAVELDEYDVVHMTYQKPSGLAYGVPYITNTIRDVLVLRQIEQTVTNILYRNLHPLQVYTVGKAEPGMEARTGEIEQVRATIADSPLDSMFIVPERHSIESIKNDYLQADGYLKYFRQRVFTGLGVSESTMGIGDTANRSTSDNQSNDLVDLVKDFQQNFMNQIQVLIDEILFEGGYDPTLMPEDRVFFEFVEIEQPAKIARENHEIQKYLSNVQSLDETRLNMGYDPTDDLSRFYANLIGGKEINPEGTVDNKNQPENQHGKNEAPKESDNKTDTSDSNDTLNVTELTKNPQEVNLQTGGAQVPKKSNQFKEGWDKTCEKIKKDQNYSIENFKYRFGEHLDDELFESSDEKDFFIDLIAGQVSENDKVIINLDTMYHFEENLKGSYKAFESIKKKGELNLNG